jgi:hypothetical protein
MYKSNKVIVQQNYKNYLDKSNTNLFLGCTIKSGMSWENGIIFTDLKIWLNRMKPMLERQSIIESRANLNEAGKPKTVKSGCSINRTG